MKYCGCCKKTLDPTYFAKNKAKKDGLQERCKKCRAEHHQTIKHLRKPQTRDDKRRYLIQSYGISVNDYENILSSQNNSCAICGSDDWGKPSPSIDHCHSTGEVRGLLCNKCNRALGMFGDDVFNMFNAIKYLWRAGLKDSDNEIQDLEKAMWYINDKIEQLKNAK